MRGALAAPPKRASSLPTKRRWLKIGGAYQSPQFVQMKRPGFRTGSTGSGLVAEEAVDAVYEAPASPPSCMKMGRARQDVGPQAVEEGEPVARCHDQPVGDIRKRRRRCRRCSAGGFLGKVSRHKRYVLMQPCGCVRSLCAFWLRTVAMQPFAHVRLSSPGLRVLRRLPGCGFINRCAGGKACRGGGRGAGRAATCPLPGTDVTESGEVVGSSSMLRSTSAKSNSPRSSSSMARSRHTGGSRLAERHGDG